MKPVGSINDFLQKRLQADALDEVDAVTAGAWLDGVGLLPDSPTRRGKPLRDLLRAGAIAGQHQYPNRRWAIRRLDATTVFEDELAGQEPEKEPPPLGAIEILDAWAGQNGSHVARLNPGEKLQLAIAFAERGKPVYGQAFDAVLISEGPALSLKDRSALRSGLDRITLVEIKATAKTGTKPRFGGHFFGITTAEVLVAQKLGHQYRFAFVNLHSRECEMMTIREIMTRAKAIYPTWSVVLDDAGPSS